MEIEIEGTLKLPTLYFNDEKLIVKDRNGTKKIYEYEKMNHFEMTYNQMFANFATFTFQYNSKSIVIAYNKIYTKKLERAIDQIKEQKRISHKLSSPFSFDNLPSDPFEFMKKFKEMLDLGIITQEEFDEKKKEAFKLKS